MELEEFQSNCNNKKCLKRQRYDSKTCTRESKQINCHKSYIRLEAKKIEMYKQTKQEFTDQYDIDNEVWLRDTNESKGKESKRDNWKLYCRIWRILTLAEKKLLEDTSDDLWMNKDLDVAHIKPKSTHIKEKQDLNNLVLIGRFFHRRLTDLKDPITGDDISNKDAVKWLEQARDGKRN